MTKATSGGDTRNGRCGGFSLPDVSDGALVSIVVMQGQCVRIISKIVSKSCLSPLPAAQTQWHHNGQLFKILVTRSKLDFNNFKHRYSENAGENRTEKFKFIIF